MKQVLPLICAAVLLIACCVGAIGLAASVYRSHIAARADTVTEADYFDVITVGEQFPGESSHAEYSYLNGDPPTKIIDDDGIMTRINSSTIIVFEYLYLDGAVERVEELSPPFMLGMTLAGIEEAFFEWTVADFTESKLVMRRYVENTVTHHYIVGIHEGYVAVFYGFGENNGSLMKITRTSVSALPHDEVQRLQEGILIIGTDKLFRVLQDYGS